MPRLMNCIAVKPAPISHDRAALIAQWHKKFPYTGGYLESRGLTAATIEAFSDRIRLDERGNVVFRHDDRQGLSGWEIKNKGFTGFSSGGHKALFACRIQLPRETDPPRLIVAESAIDAMSYQQLNPRPALVLSFGGSLSPEQDILLRSVLTQYPAAKIIMATDVFRRRSGLAHSPVCRGWYAWFRPNAPPINCDQ